MVTPVTAEGPPVSHAHLANRLRRAAIENPAALRRAVRRAAFRTFVSRIRDLCAASADLRARPNPGERPVPANFAP